MDSKNKTVTLDTKETIGYDALVLAPGAIPRRLPVPGADLGNVFTLRYAEDAQKIDSGLFHPCPSIKVT